MPKDFTTYGSKFHQPDFTWQFFCESLPPESLVPLIRHDDHAEDVLPRFTNRIDSLVDQLVNAIFVSVAALITTSVLAVREV